ncbi:MAG: DUF2934 domain-containing protein [Methylococcaceae bacterium]
MLNKIVENINRHQWIAEAAYFKAEARGFEPGKTLDDWLEAEIDFSEMLIALYISLLEEDGPITNVSLRQLAKFIGIQNSEVMMSESELVRAIQHATKHRPCFRSEANKICREKECKWRAECRKLISIWY